RSGTSSPTGLATNASSFSTLCTMSTTFLRPLGPDSVLSASCTSFANCSRVYPMSCPPCRDACSEPPERDDGYAGGALVGGLGGRPEPPMSVKPRHDLGREQRERTRRLLVRQVT